jgi:hypothetical protein
MGSPQAWPRCCCCWPCRPAACCAHRIPQGGYKRELEKIDRLPEASRDNIREQLIDLIMENGEWSPGDAERDYPYRPSAAARDDPDLAREEQEAWDEQIEKYHAREAAAYGAYRGPVTGPGNPDGAEGGTQGQAGQQGQPGQQGAAGQSGSAGSAARSASSTYTPESSSRQAEDDRPSTAGVSESALDFILGRNGGRDSAGQASPGAPGQAATEPVTAEEAASAAPRSADDAEANTPQDLRGILAIEDLDKLGDSVRPPPEEDEDETANPEDPDDGR